MEYPTPSTVAEWDDASLFAAAGSESALRYGTDGFEALNDVERSLALLYLLEAEVNNGGFGQWIWSVCPRGAAETPLVLQMIGATDMAAFVSNALLPFGDLTQYATKEEWLDNYLAFADATGYADDLPVPLESLTKPFLELEDSFLLLAYAYTRKHWKNVRTG